MSFRVRVKFSQTRARLASLPALFDTGNDLTLAYFVNLDLLGYSLERKSALTSPFVKKKKENMTSSRSASIMDERIGLNSKERRTRFQPEVGNTNLVNGKEMSKVIPGF